MASTPEAAAHFVGQLVEAGAAGLVVELSAAYPSVPEPRCAALAPPTCRWSR